MRLRTSYRWARTCVLAGLWRFPTSTPAAACPRLRLSRRRRRESALRRSPTPAERDHPSRAQPRRLRFRRGAVASVLRRRVVKAQARVTLMDNGLWPGVMERPVAQEQVLPDRE